MIHHSLTTDGSVVSWGAIERYHREVRGWQDIGYHYGVEKVGDSYHAFVGRREDLAAAACAEGGMNRRAIHICCVGDYDVVTPPAAMVKVLVKRLVAPLLVRHSIRPGDIVRHENFAPYKTCPGQMFDLEVIRKELRDGLSIR